MQGEQSRAARRPDRAWTVAVAGLVALGTGLRIASFSLFDLRYADELTQYLEQANRFLTGHGIVPWEWRLGLRNALIPYLLVPPLALGRALAPGTLLGFALARIAYAALTLQALPAAWRLGALVSRRHALVALAVVALWWESVLYTNLLLAESLAAVLVLLAAASMLQPSASARQLALAGLLCGLGMLVRFQFAVFVAILAVGALRFERARWVPYLCGCVVAAAVGILGDLAAGLAPFSWFWTNLLVNVGQDQASRFGVAPPTEYALLLWRHLWPVAPLVLAAAIAAGPRYRPLLLAALVHIAAHSLIAHKEYRFIWISVLALLVLAAIGSVTVLERVLADRTGEARARPVALAMLILAWVSASTLSAKSNGGIVAARVGGALPELADLALRDPGVCAIALPFDDRYVLLPVALRRPVPLLLSPAEDDVAGGSPRLPAAVVDGANALLLTHAPEDKRLRRERCMPYAGDQVCLYRRSGSCRPAGDYSYQRMLEKHQL
ncbi:glycosyltransferase family protein [Novosphingobium huizhouense]|uniref:hypothetical protein n=1 Tax=Novosphingobium huizhouense TaxID=2866625 RepID=UPI001CD857FB|nr:hypothetical protein [Novosphingobium huizhouense]